MKLGVGVVAAICCLGGPAAAAAQVPAPAPTPAPAPKVIAAGVTSGGVPLGGLTGAQAVAALRTQLLPRAKRRFEVHVGRRTFVLTTGRLRMRFDAPKTVRAAFKAKANRAVAPAIAYRSASLSAFARRAELVTRRTPRNGSIRITVRRIYGKGGRNGSHVSASRIDKAIRRRLADPLLGRGITPKVLRVRAAVTLAGLRRANRTILTVDRGGHRLRVFKNLRYDRSYPVAVGAAGFETPTGIRRVLSRQVNPAWTAPNRPWAGSLAGRTIPAGSPDNPLKARFIALGDGIGIHGTAESFSIGRSASHGCIRMHVRDVVDLFPRVPLGTQVLIR